jgi:nucleotide-binding universal stress UspA family protein
MGKESGALSIFPTKILLATDGSEEAELAVARAVELSQRTDSELHIVHVGLAPILLAGYPGTLGYDRKLYEQIEEEARELLREQCWRVKASGGTVDGTHLRMGAVDLEIVTLAKEIGAGLIVMGCRGHRGVREGHRGEHLRCGYPSRLLPGPGGTLAGEGRGLLTVCPPERRRSINAPMGTSRCPSSPEERSRGPARDRH